MSRSTRIMFQEIEAGFCDILTERLPVMAMIEALMDHAFHWLDRVGEGVPVADPPGERSADGAPSCCRLRVAATAPEIFLMADHIRRLAETSGGPDLRRAIILAHNETATMSKAERAAAAIPCPLIVHNRCILNGIRTLACRDEMPVLAEHVRILLGLDDDERGHDGASTPAVRRVVQAALQSALRRHGLAWGLYELNQGLALALAKPVRRDDWLEGRDSLAPVVSELNMTALGSTFDALAALA